MQNAALKSYLPPTSPSGATNSRTTCPSTESQGTAFKSIGPGLLGEKAAEDLQILAHFRAEIAEPVHIAIGAGAKGVVDGVGEQRVEIEGQPVLFADAGGGGIELLLVIKRTGGGSGRADAVVGREGVGGVARRHDAECVVTEIDAVRGDAGERVWHGGVPIVLVDEGDGVGDFATCGAGGRGIRRQAVGVLGGPGVARCESDEFMAYAGSQAFEEVSDPQAEVNVVDNAGAKGFDGFVE